MTENTPLGLSLCSILPVRPHRGSPTMQGGHPQWSGVEWYLCMKAGHRHRPFKAPLPPHTHIPWGMEGGGVLWPQRNIYFLPHKGKGQQAE